jgi:hypothetical protein
MSLSLKICEAFKKSCNNKIPMECKSLYKIFILEYIIIMNHIDSFNSFTPA